MNEINVSKILNYDLSCYSICIAIIVLIKKKNTVLRGKKNCVWEYYSKCDANDMGMKHSTD